MYLHAVSIIDHMQNKYTHNATGSHCLMIKLFYVFLHSGVYNLNHNTYQIWELLETWSSS